MKPIEVTCEREVSDTLIIDFKALCYTENDGIGPYEYWGQKCYDHGHDYPAIDGGIYWDEYLYSEEENETIDSWLKANYSHIEDMLLDKYEDIIESSRYDGE